MRTVQGGRLRLGVVTGLAAEARVARRLSDMVGTGGGTAEGARVAAERLIAAGCNGLLSFGLAGGLDPALAAGTVLVPRAVEVTDRLYPTDPALCAWLGGETNHIVLGAMQVVATAAEKRALHQSTKSAAIDMESGQVAEAAARAGLPFAVLRAICDPADRDLPPAALVALDSAGVIRVRRVAASVLASPRQIPLLIRLGRDAQLGRRRLLRRIRVIRDQHPVKEEFQ